MHLMFTVLLTSSVLTLTNFCCVVNGCECLCMYVCSLLMPDINKNKCARNHLSNIAEFSLRWILSNLFLKLMKFFNRIFQNFTKFLILIFIDREAKNPVKLVPQKFVPTFVCKNTNSDKRFLSLEFQLKNNLRSSYLFNSKILEFARCFHSLITLATIHNLCFSVKRERKN